MKISIFLILLLALFSCKHESKFNLEKDLYQFSDKMENGDTLEIKTDLSACAFFAYEVYTLTKRNDTLFLETYSEINTFGKSSQVLPKSIYRVSSKSDFSFENFFKYLKKHNTPVREYSRPLVTINYKNKIQSHQFYDADLRDKFDKLDKFSEVRKNIYPKDSFFKGSEPPPPPKQK